MKIPKAILTKLVDASIDPSLIQQFVEAAEALPSSGIVKEILIEHGESLELVDSLLRRVLDEPSIDGMRYDDGGTPLGLPPLPPDEEPKSPPNPEANALGVPPPPPPFRPPEEPTEPIIKKEKKADWQKDLWRDKPWNDE